MIDINTYASDSKKPNACFNNKNNLPIGVFDSGMGGLTVLRELIKKLPNESFIYLGDTARLPYGVKSAETVKHYAHQMVSLLVSQSIKMLVIACNTVSANALTFLKSQFPDLPILDVVQPGALAAVNATKNKHIALLATEATLRSRGYVSAIQAYDASISITSQSCGLLVALAEEGFLNNDFTKAVLRHYLAPIQQKALPCDTWLLGCTHFPVFEELIRDILNQNNNNSNHHTTTVINSAEAVTQTAATALDYLHIKSNNKPSPIRFWVTDLPERFIRIAPTFLGQAINPSSIELINNRRFALRGIASQK